MMSVEPHCCNDMSYTFNFILGRMETGKKKYWNDLLNGVLSQIMNLINYVPLLHSPFLKVYSHIISVTRFIQYNMPCHVF